MSWTFFNGMPISGGGRFLWSTYWATQTEAYNFGTAAGITDEIQQRALVQFVKDLKAINAVDAGFVDFDTPANSICLAIYPFVGGTANAHKFNLINPADTNGAYRITWSGGLTHGDYGVKGDGTNGSGATHLSTTLLGAANHGIDTFLNGGAETSNSWVFINGGSPYIYQKSAGSLTYNKDNVPYSNDQSVTFTRKNQYNSSQLININRRSNALNGLDIWFAGRKITGGTLNSNTPHNSEFTLMSFGGSFASKCYISFAAIRQRSISDAAMTMYIAAIFNYQNNLNRLSKKNIVFEGHSFFHNQPGGTSVDWCPEQTIYKLNSVYANRVYSAIMSAVSGSTIQDCIDRKTTAVDAYKVSSYGVNNIIPIWLGTNEINNTPGTGITTYNLLKTYYNSLVADGWIPIVLTMTEKSAGAGQQEVERGIFNNLIKTDLGATYIIDCDTIPELTDSTNTTYFQGDQLHLTKAANLLVSDELKTIISTI